VLSFVFLAASGCGAAMTDVPALSVSIPAGQARVFDDLVSVARSRGYDVRDADPTTGRFSFAAQHRVRATETIVFTVQCYRDGFAQLSPSGPRVERRQERYHLPSGAGEEYRDLAVAFEDALRGMSR
jgi:hypothetical protein